MSDVVDAAEEFLRGEPLGLVRHDLGNLARDLVAEVKRLRTSTMHAQVTEFHKAFGQAIGERPAVPSDDVVRLRVSLIMEEAFEAFEAAYSTLDSYDAILEAKKGAQLLIGTLKPSMDLVEFIDACQDLDYVVEGARLTCGVSGEPCAAEVHKSNMAKLGPDGKAIVRADGKRMKPAGWKPPDIAGELRRQGWSP